MDDDHSVSPPHDARDAIPLWIERVGRLSWYFVGFAIAVIFVVAALAAVREVVIPLVVAGVSAVIFAPIVDWLALHRVPRGAGAALTTMLVVGIIVLAVGAVVVGVVDRSDELEESLGSAWNELGDHVDRSGLAWLNDRLDLAAVGSSILEGAGIHVGALVGSAVGLVAGSILGLVLLYYLLKDGHQLLTQAVAARSPGQPAQADRILAKAAGTVRGHARGRSALAAVQGVFTFVAMTLLGVPLAGTIAIVNFVGAFVPYLGAFVGGAFAVVMALSTGDVPLAIWALVAVVVMNVVVENLLEPRFIGESIDLHPVVVLLATVAGGVLAGLVGLILAAPAVAIGSDLIRELRASGFFDRTRATADGEHRVEPPRLPTPKHPGPQP